MEENIVRFGLGVVRLVVMGVVRFVAMGVVASVDDIAVEVSLLTHFRS